MKSFLKAIAPIWKPHIGQLDFLSNEANYKVLAFGRRWGKTDACAVRILHDVCRERTTRSLIVAPTLDQAKLLFDRVLDLFEKLRERWPFSKAPPDGKQRRTPYPSIRLGNHTISARSGHLARALRGNEADHIVIDEAAFVPEELITEVAMPMLATTKGALTMISTPRGMNHFWRFFRMGQDRQNGFWSRTAPSSESPYVSPEFLDVQRELVSERAFQTEYEAAFKDSQTRVFKTESIDASLRTSLVLETDESMSIGVDWGKYDDYTAIAVVAGSRSSARLIHCERMNGLTWKSMVERIAQVVARYSPARVLCDGTGSGDPVIEQLRDLASQAHVDSFVFTNTSKHALVDNLSWMFENNAVEMAPHPELMRELYHYESSPTSSGRLKFGAVSGYHDDLVTAFALACYALPHSSSARVEIGPLRRFSCALAHKENIL